MPVADESRPRGEFRQNFVLSAIEDEEFDLLMQGAELIDPEPRELAHDAGASISDVYFPLTSVYSVVAVVDRTRTVEVGTVGREGMVGLPFFLGTTSSPHRAFCQVRGAAVRVPADGLQLVLERGTTLHRQLHRVTHAMMVQLAQDIACRALHSTSTRTARWLLMTSDRVGDGTFPLTQEFLAQMLGVRRPTASDAARELQAARMISYTRGVITIRDRAALQGVACGCYRLLRKEFDALRTTSG